MKRIYLLFQQYIAFILFISFFLQSCGGNLPIPVTNSYPLKDKLISGEKDQERESKEVNPQGARHIKDSNDVISNELYTKQEFKELEGAIKFASTSTTNASALAFAASMGNLSVVKLLLEREADIHADDCGGRTSLHWAATNGYLKIVKLLIEKGACVNSLDKHKITPLHLATMHLKVVKFLVGNGACINAKDNNGESPLHWAVLSKCRESVKFLVENGADINAKDNDGLTPIDYANRGGRREIINLLTRH